MAIFKCKMCGGDLEITEGISIAECVYCGSKQTLPSVMDENLQNIFNRANTLRIKSEFDKAEKLYEKIIESDSTQAEAYWGLILCKYGIEYVDDPATFKKVPTCHRASYDSIIADDDYKSALQYADGAQRTLYEEQAKEIDRIQKEILALAQKEENYDVFICYKETDAAGSRTQDSVIANDIYYQLTNEGFKVFYAAITLEGKLGSAYEPIIFAALNSAKVMLAIGTKPEYFNAVWVKNEWSRYLKIIQKDRTKLLIPCYRDMDAYELPEEFAHLQAQDMSKIGFINDVVRGIKKVISTNEPTPTVVKETVIASSNTNIAPLLKRVFIFLEDGDWNSADEYCEKVLDIDPECAEAYLGKLLAELKVRKREDLKNQAEAFSYRNNYQKAIRFADEKLKNELNEYMDNRVVKKTNSLKCGFMIKVLSIISLVSTTLTCISYIGFYDPYYDYFNGEWVYGATGIFFSPHSFSLKSLLLMIVQIILLLLYIFKYHSKFKATVIIPMIFGVLGLDAIFNFLIGYGGFSSSPIRELLYRVFCLGILVCSILAVISALKGFSKKVFIVISMAAYLLYNTVLFLIEFPGLLGPFYADNNTLLYIYTYPLLFVGTSSLYVALLIFALKNKIPPVRSPKKARSKK